MPSEWCRPKFSITFSWQQVEVPTYSDLEYQQNLHDDSWTRQETDYLLELCRKFDLRFVVIHDRWDRVHYPNRSVEDLKERYYGISSILAKVHCLFCSFCIICMIDTCSLLVQWSCIYLCFGLKTKEREWISENVSEDSKPRFGKWSLDRWEFWCSWLW